MARTREGRSLLYWFAAGHWANDSAPGAVWILAPAIGIALNLSPGELGLLIAIHFMGASLAYLPAGILADRVADHGKLLRMTFIWVTLGYLLAASAPGFWSIAIIMAIAGFGDAAWHPIATGVLTRINPKARAEALGIHAAGGTLAEVTAPLAMGFLLAYLDWRWALAVATIPAAIMFFIFAKVAQRVPRAASAKISLSDIKDLAHHWRRPAGLGLVISIIFYNMSFMAVLAMMPLYLQSEHAFTSAETGIAFAAAILLGAIVQPWCGRLSDRIGRRPITIAGNIIAVGAGLAVWQGGGSLPVALVGIGLLVMALTGIRAAFLAGTVDYAEGREATTLGFAFVLLDGVGAMGAWLAGLAAESGLAYAFLLAAFLAFISAATTFGFHLASPAKSLRDPNFVEE